jgi:hypothetical protein
MPFITFINKCSFEVCIEAQDNHHRAYGPAYAKSGSILVCDTNKERVVNCFIINWSAKITGNDKNVVYMPIYTKGYYGAPNADNVFVLKNNGIFLNGKLFREWDQQKIDL